jgi:hypothetical protein
LSAWVSYQFVQPKLCTLIACFALRLVCRSWFSPCSLMKDQAREETRCASTNMEGNAMRNRMLLFCVSATAGTLMEATFFATPRAHTLPLSAHYGIASEVYEAHSRHNIAYVCRRNAYGRTCTYVWTPDRNVRSDRPHAIGAYPSASQAHGYYPYGTGYFPWYWANPQGAD